MWPTTYTSRVTTVGGQNSLFLPPSSFLVYLNNSIYTHSFIHSLYSYELHRTFSTGRNMAIWYQTHGQVSSVLVTVLAHSVCLSPMLVVFIAWVLQANVSSCGQENTAFLSIIHFQPSFQPHSTVVWDTYATSARQHLNATHYQIFSAKQCSVWATLLMWIQTQRQM